MKYAVCCVALSAMRREPSHKVEMVSQQLFGECCTVLEEIGDWAKIKCRYDDYQGWVQLAHLTEIDASEFAGNDEILTAELVNEVDYQGNVMIVPFASAVTTLPGGRLSWSKNLIHYSGNTYNRSRISNTPQLVKEFALKYLNTPYLWGGKSVFGIDCSGFSQQVYKLLNLTIPRDASQQALHGITINLLQEVKCGDLAFFDNEDGAITHVGILLSENEILHASGKVRLDKIEDQGIVNVETNLRTHNLTIIKRYF